MRHVSFILFFLIGTYSTFAQQKAKREIEKKGIIYNKEIGFGAYLATNGMGAFAELGKIQSVKKTRLMFFSISEIRDMKARKQKAENGFFGSVIESPKDFFFGKQNNFYQLRAGIGQKLMLADKGAKNGVRVSFSYMAGFSLGLRKPYYLDLAYLIDDSDPRFQTYAVFRQKYSERTHDKFMDWYSITSASGFKHGLKEMEPIPGGFFKTGFNFDWASHEEYQIAMEVGLLADIYYKRVPLMIEQKANFMFVGAYLHFQFGKRKV